MLEIKNVNKHYGKFQALHEVNFAIEAGDFTGLLGVNGAGKTTLISAIAGINKFQGSIKVNGYDVVKDVVPARKSIGVVPQELAFDPFLTVYQTLKLQAGLYGVNNKEWLFELIARMHLQDKADTNTRALSGGMKRRLMVAQALVHKPQLIILDEPTAGVDVEIRKSLWEFIRELNKNGHTILLTTHYLEEVEELCNKIVMIDKGSVIAENGTSELLKKSANFCTKVEVDVLSQNLSIEKKTYHIKNKAEIADIINKIKDSGSQIEDLKIIEPTLEEIFIEYINTNR